ncbi:methyltransferase [Vineibacter terrae]|uniref:Methyltransferase n=1 Tax=Vineibacter terrae TaxID=2586908 RepID=A0A5C8PPA4_9HYPH|nr:class I SAM-dependent methyltransferase [Vineibacter terrae]TXL76029.1 methyltransferase [Vineibacter terrae]
MTTEPATGAAPQARTAEQQAALVWSHIRGFHATHLMATGIEAGLFNGIDKRGTATPAQLAADLGLHAPYVTTWCRTACAYELLDADGPQAFRLAPFMREILVASGDPRHIGAYVTVMQRFGGPDLADHARLYRTGGVFTFQQHGRDFSDLIADTTGGLQTFVARRLLPGVPGVRERLEAGCHLLDVGCGAGGLMMRIAQAWPKVRCHGVDVDAHGIAAARARIAGAGLAERVTVAQVGGEAAQDDQAFDVATMFEVLHEIPVADRAGVLAQTFRALKPGGILFVLDETYPSTHADLRKPDHAFSVQTGYNELTWGNVVPTREEQEALLTGAGFRDIERTMVAGMFTTLTARKP